MILLQTLLVHRSILEKVPFRTHKDHEDWAWLLDAWHLAGARVVFAWEPLILYNVATESISRSRRTNWADSLAWAREYRHWMGRRAFCSFLATKAALKAKRAGDWAGMREIASAVVAAGPGVLDLLLLAGIALLPCTILQASWKWSLRSGEGNRRDHPDVVATST